MDIFMQVVVYVYVLYFKTMNLPNTKSTKEPSKSFTFEMVFETDITQAKV